MQRCSRPRPSLVLSGGVMAEASPRLTDAGAVLSAVYAFGLGLPFVVAALAYRRALSAFAVVRRHQHQLREHVHGTGIVMRGAPGLRIAQARIQALVHCCGRGAGLRRGGQSGSAK